MGDLAQKLGAQQRFHLKLPGNLRELAIIITARYWNAQYDHPILGDDEKQD